MHDVLLLPLQNLSLYFCKDEKKSSHGGFLKHVQKSMYRLLARHERTQFFPFKSVCNDKSTCKIHIGSFMNTPLQNKGIPCLSFFFVLRMVDKIEPMTQEPLPLVLRAGCSTQTPHQRSSQQMLSSLWHILTPTSETKFCSLILVALLWSGKVGFRCMPVARLEKGKTLFKLTLMSKICSTFTPVWNQACFHSEYSDGIYDREDLALI